MAGFQTPIRDKRVTDLIKQPVLVPPSPYLQKLGYGTGVGVYKLERSALSNKTGSPWAIKKLLSKVKVASAKSRLLEEAEILRKLNHPNIVGFRAILKTSNNTDECLAMEICGKSLGDLVEERLETIATPFAADKIMRVAFDVGLALQYLHTKASLIHGDIKSYNVLVADNFSVCKVCDFGVTLSLGPKGEVDEDAVYCGTTPWCAPEVLAFPPKVTAKADIYAYGLTLWEMLALSPPFSCDPEEEIDESIEEDSVVGEGDESLTTNSAARQRPELPDQELGEEYKYVLQIFYCTTEVDFEKRPSADDLVACVEQMTADFKHQF